MTFYLPYIVLALFFAAALFAVKNIKPAYSTMASADHNIPWWIVAMSIMVTFAAPIGLLQAGGFGYSGGIPSLLVYVTAYCLVYIAYAYFAARLKTDHPQSLTISDVLRTGVGPKTGLILRTMYTLGPIYGVLLNLTGMKIITDMWGFSQMDSFIFMSLSMLAVVVYCWNGGLASSIRTDIIQTGLLIGTSLVIFVMIAANWGNFDNLAVAMDKPFVTDLLLNPGLLFIFILGGALFSDVEQFNRVSAVKNASHVKRAFFGAAVIAGVIMLGYGLMGALADPGLANKDHSVVKVILGSSEFVQILFVFALVALLVANLDSSVVAGGIMTTHEWLQREDIKAFRIAMIVTAVAGLGLSFLGLSIIHILMGWACYRLSTLPSVIAFALRIRYSDRVWAWSFLAAFVVGATIVFSSFYNKLGINVTMIGYTVMLIISSIGIYLGHRAVRKA